MGWNDHIDDDYVELPPEAERAAYPFDPHDKWLRDASREHQFEAMRRWFLARFEDPAESTPYDNGEGGYLFLHGSVDPDDAIQERFSPFVDFEVMQELVNELYSHVGPEWATIDRGEDYWDDELAVYIESRDEPMARMSLRLSTVVKQVTVQQYSLGAFRCSTISDPKHLELQRNARVVIDREGMANKRT